MFIETVIGSKAKVKILRALAERRTAYSLKNIKAETELSLSITHRVAEELAEEGIALKIKGTRKERLYKFNTDHSCAAAIYELFKIEKTRQRKEIIFLHTWSVLEDVVSKIKATSSLVVLFGSQARGDATLNSDIDLLVILKNAQDEILETIKKIKTKNTINPTVLSHDALHEEIQNNTLFYRNLKKDAVVLYAEPEAKGSVAKFLEDIQYKR